MSIVLVQFSKLFVRILLALELMSVVFRAGCTDDKECPNTPPDPFNVELGKFKRPEDWPEDAYVCFRTIFNLTDFHRRLNEALERKRICGTNDRIFTLFFASMDSNKKFWCPDCERAAPIIRNVLPKISPNSTFLITYVGDRPTWKDMNNVFRTDSDVKLQAIPTLIEWGTHKKLVEADLFDEGTVSEFIQQQQTRE